MLSTSNCLQQSFKIDEKTLRLALIKVGNDKNMIRDCALELLTSLKHFIVDSFYVETGLFAPQVHWTFSKGLFSFKHWCTLNYHELKAINGSESVTEQTWPAIAESIRGAVMNDSSWTHSCVPLSPAAKRHKKMVSFDFGQNQQANSFTNNNIYLNHFIRTNRENFIFVIGRLSDEMLAVIKSKSTPQAVLKLMLLGEFLSGTALSSFIQTLNAKNLSVFFMVTFVNPLTHHEQEAIRKMKSALALVNGTIIVRCIDASYRTGSIRRSPSNALLLKCLFLSHLKLFDFSMDGTRTALKIDLTHRQNTFKFEVFCRRNRERTVRLGGNSVKIDKNTKLCVKNEYELALNDRCELIAVGLIRAKLSVTKDLLVSGSYLASTEADNNVVISWHADIPIAFMFEIIGGDRIEERYVKCTKETMPVYDVKGPFNRMSHVNELGYGLDGEQLKKLTAAMKRSDGISLRTRFTDTTRHRSVQERVISCYGKGSRSPYDLPIGRLTHILQNECERVYRDGTCDKAMIDWVCTQCVKKWESSKMGDIVSKLLTPIWRGPIYFQNLKAGGDVEENAMCNMINVQVRIGLIIGRRRSLDANKRVDYDLIFEILNVIRWATGNLCTYRHNPVIDMLLKNPSKAKFCDGFIRTLVEELRQDVVKVVDQDAFENIPTVQIDQSEDTDRADCCVRDEEKRIKNSCSLLTRYCEAQSYSRTAISEFNTSKRFISIIHSEKREEEEEAAVVVANVTQRSDVSSNTGTYQDIDDIPVYGELEQRMNRLSPLRLKCGQLGIPTILERLSLGFEVGERRQQQEKEEGKRNENEEGIFSRKHPSRKRSILEMTTKKKKKQPDSAVPWKCGCEDCPRRNSQTFMSSTQFNQEINDLREQIRQRRLQKAKRKRSYLSLQVKAQGGETRAASVTLAGLNRVKRDISVLERHSGAIRRLFRDSDKPINRSSGYLTRSLPKNTYYYYDDEDEDEDGGGGNDEDAGSAAAAHNDDYYDEDDSLLDTPIMKRRNQQ